MYELEEMLRLKAQPVIDEANDYFGGFVKYLENVNIDALSNDWLENRTSFIWKVGILYIVDANKADWVYIYIGHQRDDKTPPDFIGSLHYNEGENDDIYRCLKRYINLFDENIVHPVFSG